MKLRVTSSAIGIGSMAASSHADCAPWASGDKPTAPASPWQNGFAEFRGQQRQSKHTDDEPEARSQHVDHEFERTAGLGAAQVGCKKIYT
jgi:hypothetical protein